MISNSGHDEYNGYSGGAAGDQTGTEWYVRSWYDRPWNCVCRYPDRDVADLIADLSRQAAENNKIGYDQNERLSYWYALKDAGFYPLKIKKKCEADCSAGVLANVKAVGYILDIKKLKDIDPSGTTWSMRQQLHDAGFKVLTDKKYLTSDDYLLPGDILLNDSKHTAVNLTVGKYADGTPAPDEISEKVLFGQQWFDIYYGKLLLQVYGELLELDGIYGPKSRAAALTIWKDVCNRLYGTNLNIESKKFSSGCKRACKYAEVEFGSDGTHTFICQFLLAAKGFYTGKMDAECGRDLCTSIQAYEKARGLSVDSVDPVRCSAGPEVWSSLFEEV